MRLALALLLVAGCTHDAPDPPSIVALPVDSLAPGVTSPDSLSSDSLSPDSLVGTFEGHFLAGFEHSDFIACGDSVEAWWTTPLLTEVPIAGNQTRIDIRPAADIHTQYMAAVSGSDETVEHGRMVWARFHGRVSPRRDLATEAGYGHQGFFTRAFVVDSVEALVRDTVVAGCPDPYDMRQ